MALVAYVSLGSLCVDSDRPSFIAIERRPGWIRLRFITLRLAAMLAASQMQNSELVPSVDVRRIPCLSDHGTKARHSDIRGS